MKNPFAKKVTPAPSFGARLGGGLVKASPYVGAAVGSLAIGLVATRTLVAIDAAKAKKKKKKLIQTLTEFGYDKDALEEASLEAIMNEYNTVMIAFSRPTELDELDELGSEEVDDVETEVN